MEFGLSEEQTLLRETVTRFLDDNASLARVRNYADDTEDLGADIWAGLTDLGAAALLVPEVHGGVGLKALDAAVVAECLGAHAAPAPFLATAVLAVTALRQAGDASQQAQYLPRIADGSLRIGAALAEACGRAARPAWRRRTASSPAPRSSPWTRMQTSSSWQTARAGCTWWRGTPPGSP